MTERDRNIGKLLTLGKVFGRNRLSPNEICFIEQWKRLIIYEFTTGTYGNTSYKNSRVEMPEMSVKFGVTIRSQLDVLERDKYRNNVLLDRMTFWQP